MDLISFVLFPVLLALAGWMLLRNRAEGSARPEPVRVPARRIGRNSRRR